MIRHQERVEVHYNSLSFSEYTRLSHEKFFQKQNAEILRILQLKNPLVSIIYISPFPLPEEITSYYYKTLVYDQIENLENRLTFIYPDAYDSYTSHISLNTLLLYSHKTVSLKCHLIKVKTIETFA